MTDELSQSRSVGSCKYSGAELLNGELTKATEMKINYITQIHTHIISENKYMHEK